MMGTIRTFVAMPDWQQLEILRQAMPVFGPQFEQVGASVDGAALLRCLGEHPDRVDLVLTDLFLRDMDAVELLEHINRLQLGPSAAGADHGGHRQRASAQQAVFTGSGLLHFQALYAQKTV